MQTHSHREPPNYCPAGVFTVTMAALVPRLLVFAFLGFILRSSSYNEKGKKKHIKEKLMPAKHPSFLKAIYVIHIGHGRAAKQFLLLYINTICRIK